MTIQRSVRGIRQSCPSGYIIGRQSAGDGPAEFISFSDIGAAITSTGAIPVPVQNYAKLAITAVGPWTASQVFTLAPSSLNGTFPSAKVARVSTAKCSTAPTGDVTFYLVNNATTFFASGPPAGVVATITFAAGSTTGAIVWNGTTSVYESDVWVLVMPASADPAFAGINLLFIGDPA